MITISYATKDAAFDRILTKLKDLSLAYQLDDTSGSEDLQLADGQQTVTGETAIQAYLEQLESELGQWYYCSC